MKTHVYFAVFDFGDDPHIVTEIIGIEPTGAWAKGDWYEVYVEPQNRAVQGRHREVGSEGSMGSIFIQFFPL